MAAVIDDDIRLQIVFPPEGFLALIAYDNGNALFLVFLTSRVDIDADNARFEPKIAFP